jgi:division protein 1
MGSLSLQNLIAAEIDSVTVKIDALEVIRRRLEGSMIKMQEEELELEDERE